MESVQSDGGLPIVVKGTVITCPHCGGQYKKPMISVDFLNDARKEIEYLKAEVQYLITGEEVSHAP